MYAELGETIIMWNKIIFTLMHNKGILKSVRVRNNREQKILWKFTIQNSPKFLKISLWNFKTQNLNFSCSLKTKIYLTKMPNITSLCPIHYRLGNSERAQGWLIQYWQLSDCSAADFRLSSQGYLLTCVGL